MFRFLPFYFLNKMAAKTPANFPWTITPAHVSHCNAYRVFQISSYRGFPTHYLHYIESYCIILYYIALYCIYCIALYILYLFIVLYCIVLYCIVLYCIVSYRIVSYRIVSYRIVSYCIVFPCQLNSGWYLSIINTCPLCFRTHYIITQKR